MLAMLDSQPMTRVRDDALVQAFAAVLRDLRQELGISQEQLALRSSVDRTFVGKLESGKHQPSLAVVFSLAQGIGTTPSELVTLVERQLDNPAE
jgi:transcriptional regulator with XRE-family HTH domain